ncbi:hypothetical protein LTR08_001610 [Meristemomyces frigidus]|nr:hypothetical protein LTR08_001610 [Meristemomyces frigidus]
MLFNPAKPTIEVNIRFGIGDTSAQVELLQLPIYEDQTARFNTIVECFNGRTLNPNELAQLLQPYERSWFFTWPAESDVEGDDPTLCYGEPGTESGYSRDDETNAYNGNDNSFGDSNA